MSSGNKDSPQIVEFMTLFARLKDWSDDAPDELADLAATDARVKDLCDQLGRAAFFLWRKERQQRELFAAEGRARAKARGVRLGRKPKLTLHEEREAIKLRDAGEPVREIARSYNVHNSTISRLAA